MLLVGLLEGQGCGLVCYELVCSFAVGLYYAPRVTFLGCSDVSAGGAEDWLFVTFLQFCAGWGDFFGTVGALGGCNVINHVTKPPERML